jgi:hypothetical protein
LTSATANKNEGGMPGMPRLNGRLLLNLTAGG